MLKHLERYPLASEYSASRLLKEVCNPFGGDAIAEVEMADAKAIDFALTRSEQVFHTVMQKVPAYERSRILAKTARLIRRKRRLRGDDCA